MDKDDRGLVVVYPSEIHKFAYCPRQYFFSLYLPQPIPLVRRLRMLLGTVYHLLKGLLAKHRGYRVEEKTEARLGNVILRGRPDAYKRSEGRLEIIERKSGKGPRRGVWISDMLQVTAYGVMLRRGEDEVLLKVEYRTGRRLAQLSSDKVALLISVVDELVLVKKYGIVPYANRSPRRCASCPYRHVCEQLDRELAPPEGSELYEPGRSVALRAVDESFVEEAT